MSALGGLGLYLVADICATHGWDADDQRKVAWCQINYTPAEAPPDGSPSIPEPRRADGDR